MRMVRPTSLPVLAIVAISLGLAGCGAAPVVRPVAALPVVTTESETPSAGFRIRLEVTNPSDEDVPLDRFDYVFVVTDVGRFEGRWTPFQTLPPGGTATLFVPASFPLPPDLAERVDPATGIDWRIDGGVRYQAPGILGQILFDAGIRRPREPFSGSGTFILTPQPNPDATPSADRTTESGN